jgi:hypothetical protein
METDGNDTLWLEDMGIIEEDVPYAGYRDYEVYDGGALIANLYVLYRFPDATNTDPHQIDAGHTAYLYFALHFKENLPQGVNYWFWIHFVFWNWNESL